MKFIKKIVLFIILICIVFIGIITFLGYNQYKEALSTTSLKYKINNLKKDSNYIKIENLPQNYKNAVVSVEDHRFYNHSAIDITSLARAMSVNIKKKDFVEGGSTITQQLAKNLYFSQKQELIRKVAELFMAFDIENNYSKDEILELYVNTSYFGDGYYGIKEASLGYFKKEPKNMNLDECTIIAGIPNAPSVYALTKNPDLAKKRQKHVIETMIENGYLSQEEADKLLK